MSLRSCKNQGAQETQLGLSLPVPLCSPFSVKLLLLEVPILPMCVWAQLPYWSVVCVTGPGEVFLLHQISFPGWPARPSRRTSP